MSEIKHSFRIMIIDIENDKVVVDEFADAIVGGIAKNGSSPKILIDQRYVLVNVVLLPESELLQPRRQQYILRKSR